MNQPALVLSFLHLSSLLVYRGTLLGLVVVLRVHERKSYGSRWALYV